MGRFGHENGPFWMLAGAVLVMFFLPLGRFWSGPFWFQWAVFDLHWGRFGDGPFWSVPILIALLPRLLERVLVSNERFIRQNENMPACSVVRALCLWIFMTSFTRLNVIYQILHERCNVLCHVIHCRIALPAQQTSESISARSLTANISTFTVWTPTSNGSPNTRAVSNHDIQLDSFARSVVFLLHCSLFIM